MKTIERILSAIDKAIEVALVTVCLAFALVFGGVSLLAITHGKVPNHNVQEDKAQRLANVFKDFGVKVIVVKE